MRHLVLDHRGIDAVVLALCSEDPWHAERKWPAYPNP